MASAEIETVRRTAALARLEIAPEEAERFGEQFARILEAFGVLAAVDPEGTGGPGSTGESGCAGEAESRSRADEPQPSLPTDAALANAPEAVDGFFSVPRTL